MRGSKVSAKVQVHKAEFLQKLLQFTSPNQQSTYLVGKVVKISVQRQELPSKLYNFDGGEQHNSAYWWHLAIKE